MDKRKKHFDKLRVEGSKKRTREEPDEESVKRQKLEDDAKKAELKLCLEIVLHRNDKSKYESILKRLEEEYHIIKDDTPLKKKGKQVAGESSLPKTSLKIIIKQKKSTPTTILPLIEKKILEEDVEKLVEGEDESDGDEFTDTDDDKKNDDDKHDDAKDNDDDDDHDDHTLIRTQETVADPELWNALKAKYEKSSALTDSYRNDAFCKRDHDEHPGDDTPPEGEKGAKRQKTSRSSKSVRGSLSKQPAKETNTSVSELLQQQGLDAWIDIPVIDEDKVISEEETPKSIDKFQNVDKRVPTIYDHERIEAIIRDMLTNKFRDTEEYAYHLDQAKKFMDNQVSNPNERPRYFYNKDLFFLKNGTTKEKKYMLSLYKIHATLFPDEDFEEKMIR
ncbi:hypothetical protein Tco_0065341 [Tanacetum coccineum]